MTKNTNSKHSGVIELMSYQIWDIGFLNLIFIWNLVLVFWCVVIK